MKRIFFTTTSFLAVIFLLLVFFSSRGLAQTGKISGTITDAATNEPLPGVNVIVDGTTLGGATDDEGFYYIINIPPGRYSLKASMIGYKIMSKSNVIVNVDRSTSLDFGLPVSAIAGEEVVVTAERPTIELDVSSSQVVLDGEELLEIPETNFKQILNKQAGISEPDMRGLFMRGGRLHEISLMIDGIETRDAIDNAVYTRINTDAVQEVQIQTGGFTAEYGDARAGIINVIGKEGGRRYTGTVDYKYYKPTRKHFGPSWYELTNDIYSSFDPVYRRDGETEIFAGWNKVAEGVDPDDDVYGAFAGKPDLCYELYKWRMRDEVVKYGDKPDINFNTTFGGPITFLENTSFFASARSQKTYYLTKATQDFFQDWDMSLKVTSSYFKSTKISLNFRYMQTSGVNRYDRRYVNAASHGFEKDNPSTTGEKRNIFESAESVAWSGLGGFNPYYQRLPVAERYRRQYGLKINHVFSPRTYMDFSVSYYAVDAIGHHAIDLDGNIIADHPNKPRIAAKIKVLEDKYGNKATLRGIYAMAPEGYYFPKEMEAITNTRIGGSEGNYENSEYNSFAAKISLTSQINKYHQIKIGGDFHYDELDKDEIRAADDNKSMIWNWLAFPKYLNAYVQDKIEWEGLIANIGLRLNTYIPNSTWYDIGNDPWNPYWGEVGYDSEDKWGLLTKGTMYKPKMKFKLAPRVGISHPIGEMSKIYFNYGHFYTLPDAEVLYRRARYSRANWRFYCIGNPEVDYEKTIQYEVGYSQSLLDMFNINVVGYYKDETDIVDEMVYKGMSGQTYEGVAYKVDYQTYKNIWSRDIRGLELRLEKRVGKYFTGWFNYDFMVYSSQQHGYNRIYEDPTQQPRAANYKSYDPTTRPKWTLSLTFNTPEDFGPKVSGSNPFSKIMLNLLHTWRSQPQFSWLPKAEEYGDPYDPVYNYRWKAHQKTNMRLSREFGIAGMFNSIFYLEIYNLFNKKNIQRNKITGGNLDTYMESLELVGGDPGDYKKAGILLPENVAPDYVPYDLFLNPRQIILGVRFIL